MVSYFPLPFNSYAETGFNSILIQNDICIHEALDQ